MMRREFVGTLGTAALGSRLSALGSGSPQRREPRAERWREEFPELSERVNGHSVIYLDSAATTLRPKPVIDALSAFYSHDNANPGATLHTLARRAAAAQDDARKTVADYIGATDPLEVVFTRGTTEGINLVASAWGGANLKPGDAILICED